MKPLKLKGKYEEAEPLHRRAMEITKATLGKGHSTYSTRLNNLAVLPEIQVTARPPGFAFGGCYITDSAHAETVLLVLRVLAACTQGKVRGCRAPLPP